METSLLAKTSYGDANEDERVKRLKVVHVGCKKYLSFHTRYFFKKQYNKKFIVSEHHKKIWEVLEHVLNGELTKVMINLPPRYGKTEIAVKTFISHGLALNPSSKYIHLSYSKTLALDNSEGVRDIVNNSAYSELFPDVKVKPKSDSKEKWYTTAGGGIYATATGGQVTGFGAGEVDLSEEDFNFLDGVANIGESNVYGKKATFSGALIIDDPMKPEDGDSDLRRGRINERFDSTIRNRVNSRKTPIIIIMQRLHEDDLCGHILKQEPDDWFVLSLPAIVDEGLETEHALWEHKHDLVELYRQRELNKIVFERQMMQKPMPKEGMMYDEFKTYSVLPVSLRSIQKCYIDTADKGKDFLCAIFYLETDTGMYVRDVYYTDEAMETTEPTTARKLAMNQSTLCRIEHNNGGDGFKRQVEHQSRLLRNYKTKFTGFTQSVDKEVRIFQASAGVNNMIFFPVNWDKMWPKFYQAVVTHQKVGKNAHDDAPDCMTGMFEFFGKDMLNNVAEWASGLH